MDFSELPIRSMMFFMGVAGAIIGGMVGAGANPIDRNQIWFFVSGGASLFMFLGWWIITWIAGAAERRESRIYQSEVRIEQPVQKTIERYYVIHLNGATHRVSLCGMTPEQWSSLAKLVVRGGYKYKQEYFERVMGDRTEGRLTYDRVSGRLNYGDIFLSVYGNGFKPTTAGEEFFDKLSEGDWQVLDGLQNE